MAPIAMQAMEINRTTLSKLMSSLILLFITILSFCLPMLCPKQGEFSPNEATFLLAFLIPQALNVLVYTSSSVVNVTE
jgi:hypothetical protein